MNTTMGLGTRTREQKENLEVGARGRRVKSQVGATVAFRQGGGRREPLGQQHGRALARVPGGGQE